MSQNNITYASHGDYMKAKVAFNAKDTEIADLANQGEEPEGFSQGNRHGAERS